MARKLSTEFYSVLIEKNLDHFTVMELRDAICSEMDQNNDTCDQREQHKRAYRVVLRLLNAGLLKKSKGPAEFARYHKTPLFSASNFQPRLATERTTDFVASRIDTPQKPSDNTGIQETLGELIKGYQVDLLSAIGESEEYMRLHQSFPQLKGSLEPHYLRSRELSSKILGKIRAIESILADLPNASTQ